MKMCRAWKITPSAKISAFMFDGEGDIEKLTNNGAKLTKNDITTLFYTCLGGNFFTKYNSRYGPREDRVVILHPDLRVTFRR